MFFAFGAKNIATPTPISRPRIIIIIIPPPPPPPTTTTTTTTTTNYYYYYYYYYYYCYHVQSRSPKWSVVPTFRECIITAKRYSKNALW